MTVVELTAARRPPVSAIEASLSGEFTLRAGETSVVEQVLLDTFDGRLRSRKLSLRWEEGELALLRGRDGEHPAASARMAAPAAPIRNGSLPEGRLRRELEDVIGVRALLPLARLTLHRQPLAVLDGLQKTVTRLVVESPVLVPPPGRPTELPVRLRLLGVRGYEEELALVRRLLERSLGAAPPRRSLFEEAVLAAGGRPEGLGTKLELRLDPDERADVATAEVLLGLLEIMDANLPGTLADTDPEFLHDLRVAIRRTRAVQRQLRGVFPAAALERLRDEFRWLQRASGDARDLDVHVLGFEQMRELAPKPLRADLDPLLVVLRRRRMVAHGAMGRELRSERARMLRTQWRELLEELPGLPEDDRPDAGRPIAELSGARIWHVYRKMRKRGRALGPNSPAADYHDLRKQGKELRYLLELFGTPLHDRATVKPMVRALKDIQDVLGHHQDREVQIRMLREAGDEVAALPGGGRALMAMGVLIERLEADAAATRAEFAEHFGAFASSAARKQARKAFR